MRVGSAVFCSVLVLCGIVPEVMGHDGYGVFASIGIIFAITAWMNEIRS